jgi:flavin-dependent dehydrogenase
MIIDASGCGASISKYVGLAKPGRGMLVNSAQFNVENLTDVDEDFVEVYFGQSFAPGFFGWIIPRRDGSAKVGIAAGGRANVRECFERFTRKHRVVSAKLKGAKQISAPMYHPIPVGGATSRTYADSMLAVGDAASQVKPTTGGGIVFGLACGQIAGETAAIAVQEGNTSVSRLGSYENRWRRLFGFDLTAMSWLRRLLYRLPDRQLDRIFRISAELNADDVLNRTADIDFQGRTLLSLARDPRLFITLLSASVLSVPSLIGTGTRKGRTRP